MRILSQRLLLITFLLLIGLSMSISAQATDFGLWNSVDLSLKLNKRTTLLFEEEFRLRNNLKTTDKLQSTLELEYKVNNFFMAGVSYTLIDYYHPGNKKHDYQNYWETRHRFNIFGEGTYDVGRFNFSLRERFQTTYRVLDSISTAKINPKLVLRSKLSVSYNIPKIPLEPYAYFELHQVLNGSEKNQIEEYRLGAGVKYKISKKISVKAGYIYSGEYDEEEGEKANIATIGMSYKF